MNIYEMTKNYEEKMELIFQDVNPETGEIIEDEEIKKQLLSELEEDLNAKNDNLIRYIKNLEAEITSTKEEEKRLAERRKAKENKVSRFKEFLVYTLDSLGKKSIETTLGKLAIRESKQVVVNDLAKLNQEYINVKESISADKTKIKAAIEGGRNVEGAFIQINKSLNIR